MLHNLSSGINDVALFSQHLNGRMLVMNDKLAIWINDKLTEKNWSQRELARRAQISHTTVSKVLSGQLKASYEFCEIIASAFGEPKETVFRIAGLLPALPSSENDLVLQELLEIAQDMSLTTRQQALKYLRFLYKDEDKSMKKSAKAAEKSGISATASQAAYYAGKNAAEDGETLEQLLSKLSQQRRKYFENKFKQELSEEINNQGS